MSTDRLPPTSVLIVDDHPAVREGMRAILETQPDVRVVGAAGSTAEAVALADRLRPGLILLDVRLPGRGGLEACRELRARVPEARILMMSGLPATSPLLHAAAAAADGFLSKESSAGEIIRIVREVVSGRAAVDQTSARTMFRSLQTEGALAPQLDSLSAREREVLALLSEALTNREIAKRLFLSEKTVRNHVSNVLRKLSFTHRTQAALFFAPLRGEF
jgi:two-component system response regulator DevR